MGEIVVFFLEILFVFLDLPEGLVHKFLNREVEGIGLLGNFLFEFGCSLHKSLSESLFLLILEMCDSFSTSLLDGKSLNVRHDKKVFIVKS